MDPPGCAFRQNSVRDHGADPILWKLRGGWELLGYVLKSDAARELVAAIQSVVRGEKFLNRGLDGHRFMDGGEQV
jgi:hypothetical protein